MCWARSAVWVSVRYRQSTKAGSAVRKNIFVRIDNPSMPSRFKDSKLEKIHFYAFGGMKKTSEWLNQFNNSDFSYNNKQKFELN